MFVKSTSTRPCVWSQRSKWSNEMLNGMSHWWKIYDVPARVLPIQSYLAKHPHSSRTIWPTGRGLVPNPSIGFKSGDGYHWRWFLQNTTNGRFLHVMGDGRPFPGDSNNNCHSDDVQWAFPHGQRYILGVASAPSMESTRWCPILGGVGKSDKKFVYDLDICRIM